MHRALFISLLGAAVLGCGGGASPVSLPGSFSMIEASVNDVSATIQDKRYKANGELGTETDRLGLALAIFVKEAKGGPHEADAEDDPRQGQPPGEACEHPRPGRQATRGGERLASDDRRGQGEAVENRRFRNVVIPGSCRPHRAATPREFHGTRPSPTFGFEVLLSVSTRGERRALIGGPDTVVGPIVNLIPPAPRSRTMVESPRFAERPEPGSMRSGAYAQNNTMTSKPSVNWLLRVELV